MEGVFEKIEFVKRNEYAKCHDYHANTFDKRKI